MPPRTLSGTSLNARQEATYGVRVLHPPADFVLDCLVQPVHHFRTPALIEQARRVRQNQVVVVNWYS